MAGRVAGSQGIWPSCRHMRNACCLTQMEPAEQWKEPSYSLLIEHATFETIQCVQLGLSLSGSTEGLNLNGIGASQMGFESKTAIPKTYQVLRRSAPL
jgi:hypothetical protein